MTAESVIAKHYAAGAAGDPQGMLADFAEDITWVEAAGGAYAGTFKGIDQVIKNVFERINAEWDDFGAVPDVLVADEAKGKVAALCTYVGTNKATGKPQNVRVVHIWTVVDGKIVAFEQVCDSVEQLKVMS